MQEPLALLADEPVASVDPARARDTVKLLSDLAGRERVTLVMSLHNLDLAREFFPRMVGLRRGRILFDRPTARSRRRSSESSTASTTRSCSQMGPDAASSAPRYRGAWWWVFSSPRGIGAAASLGLFRSSPFPGESGLDTADRFFSRALSPTLTSEDPSLEGERSLLPNLQKGFLKTITVAAASLGLSLVLGLLLGFLGSTAWWRGAPPGGPRALRWVRRTIAPLLYGVTRVFISVLRSVHEVIWAIVLLAAFGVSDVTAVVALTIPYSGTLGKVFAEIIDEAPRGAALALRSSGAGPAQVFAVGLLPRAIAGHDRLRGLPVRVCAPVFGGSGLLRLPTLGYFLAWLVPESATGVRSDVSLRADLPRRPRGVVERCDSPEARCMSVRADEIRRLKRARPRKRLRPTQRPRAPRPGGGLVGTPAPRQPADRHRDRGARLERFLEKVRPYL